MAAPATSASASDGIDAHAAALEKVNGHADVDHPKEEESSTDAGSAATPSDHTAEEEIETKEAARQDAHTTPARSNSSKPGQLDVPIDDHDDVETPAPTPIPAPLTISASAAATEPATSPLDALLSPKSPDASFEARQSVAASDATDDDGRFSTVLLSARQSLDTDNLSLAGTIPPSLSSTIVEEEPEHDGKRDTLNELDGSELIRMVHTNRQHKKTASTSTIVSASNVPFLLARLDAQNDEEQTGVNRRSLDGQHKLQEDFNRMHLESETVEQEDTVAAGGVDWGKHILPVRMHLYTSILTLWE